MPGLVEGKAGLVTGAAGGIGRATALALAREGAAGVLVTDLEARREDCLQTVRLIEQEGGHAEFVAGDVRVEADCRAVVEHTLEAFGHIDFAHNKPASNCRTPSSAPRRPTSTSSSPSTSRASGWA
jgi:NAD(P)-dependent dehydrogenase (short-subunit alcohol dehydrogenase family)